MNRGDLKMEAYRNLIILVACIIITVFLPLGIASFVEYKQTL